MSYRKVPEIVKWVEVTYDQNKYRFCGAETVICALRILEMLC